MNDYMLFLKLYFSIWFVSTTVYVTWDPMQPSKLLGKYMLPKSVFMCLPKTIGYNLAPQQVTLRQFNQYIGPKVTHLSKLSVIYLFIFERGAQTLPKYIWIHTYTCTSCVKYMPNVFLE